MRVLWVVMLTVLWWPNLSVFLCCCCYVNAREVGVCRSKEVSYLV